MSALPVPCPALLIFLQNIGMEGWILVIIILFFVLRPRGVGRLLGRTKARVNPSPTTSTRVATPPDNTHAACYADLDLTESATPEAVRQSYRELVKVWHPDRFGHDAKLRQRATEKLKQINAAYESLQRAGRA